MDRERYNTIPQVKLSADASYTLPDALLPLRVRADSPAIEVMTDLRRIPAATVGPDVNIEEAHRAMIIRGVRLLLVTDSQRHVMGLLTAADLLGERPVRSAQERGIKRSELAVRDIMTGAGEIDAISLSDVLHAEVGHVVATLKSNGRQHALVVDEDVTGQQMIRGIFSASQIARQVGIPLQTTEVARTFAEIEAAIGR
ncbi:MAG: CBS domain-containing protein [Rhodocyclaceae bacterium]|nr:CBS domain-containing protein [Rhodocyclaceae bacterium]